MLGVVMWEALGNKRTCKLLPREYKETPREIICFIRFIYIFNIAVCWRAAVAAAAVGGDGLPGDASIV